MLAALWVFLPAYVANMSPVFVAKLIPRWTTAIDGGRLAKDGKRVLGPGKTWRGLMGGAVMAAVTALLLAQSATGIFDAYDFGRAGPRDRDGDLVPGSPSSLWAIALYGGFVGAMALVGDAVKSYFKRRRGKERGASWIPFDQLDFVVFGLAAMAVGAPLLADGWVLFALLGDPLVLPTIVVGTVGLHLLVNRIGYHLGLKEVPW